MIQVKNALGSLGGGPRSVFPLEMGGKGIKMGEGGGDWWSRDKKRKQKGGRNDYGLGGK